MGKEPAGKALNRATCYCPLPLPDDEDRSSHAQGEPGGFTCVDLATIAGVPDLLTTCTMAREEPQRWRCRMKPPIDATQFGSITLGGAIHDHDVLVCPDATVKPAIGVA